MLWTLKPQVEFEAAYACIYQCIRLFLVRNPEYMTAIRPKIHFPPRINFDAVDRCMHHQDIILFSCIPSNMQCCTSAARPMIRSIRDNLVIHEHGMATIKLIYVYINRRNDKSSVPMRVIRAVSHRTFVLCSLKALLERIQY